MEIHFNIISLSSGEVLAKSEHKCFEKSMFQHLYNCFKMFSRQCEFQSDNYRCMIDVVFPFKEQNLF